METPAMPSLTRHAVAVPVKYFKKALKSAFRKAIEVNIALNGHKHRYVFVLAHMRSGSTLLSHILGSNPEFAYGGESYTMFQTSADLRNLTIETCQRLRRLSLGETYVVGQINWASLADSVLKSPLIYKCVILIRSPEATLRSRVVTPAAPGQPGMQEKDALDYYVHRLEQLVGYGRTLGNRAMLIEYDDLVDNSEETLDALTDFFNVDQPFHTKYKLHRVTGGYGDPSKNIWSGQIIRTPPHNAHIDADTLAKASTAFHNCRERLLIAGVKSARRV